MELKFDRKQSVVFRRKYIKIEIRFDKPYLVVCVLCFYRFSKLLEAVLGDFLLNGRCDGMSRRSKHTTGKVFQTLFRF